MKTHHRAKTRPLLRYTVVASVALSGLAGSCASTNTKTTAASPADDSVVSSSTDVAAASTPSSPATPGGSGQLVLHATISLTGDIQGTETFDDRFDAASPDTPPNPPTSCAQLGADGIDGLNGLPSPDRATASDPSNQTNQSGPSISLQHAEGTVIYDGPRSYDHVNSLDLRILVDRSVAGDFRANANGTATIRFNADGSGDFEFTNLEADAGPSESKTVSGSIVWTCTDLPPSNG